MLSQFLARLGRAGRNERGSATVEFTLLAPVMFILFVGLVEVGNVIITGRATNHVANALADLTAQKTNVTDATMTDIFAAGNQLIIPNPTTGLKMKVTSVTMDTNRIAKVDWSSVSGSVTPDTQGATYSGLPASLLSNPGDTLILATAQYTLTQASQDVIKAPITYSRIAYVKPRNGKVTRSAT